MADSEIELHGEAAYRFATSRLRELRSDAEAWTVLYEDPSNGEQWLMEFPESDLHGGGPPLLTKLASPPDNVDEGCGCAEYPSLELARSFIRRRIDESGAIQASLELLSASEDGVRLYRCVVCERLWQRNVALNWGAEPYLFRIPSISVEKWEELPFVAPDQILIFDAVMSRYFDENDFEPGTEPCARDDCANRRVLGLTTCVEHHVETLRRVGNLPPTPRGRSFPPYDRNAGSE